MLRLFISSGRVSQTAGVKGEELAGVGNAGTDTAKARANARCKADHSGGHRSHAAAMERSSQAGISQIVVTSQGLLPVLRKSAAEPM